MSWGKELFDLSRKGAGLIFIESILESGADIDARNGDGHTLLTLAAKYGDEVIVRYLVGQGADPSARRPNGATAMHIAARHGRVEVMRMLFQVDVHVDICDNNNCTPLHYAAAKGNHLAVKLLLEQRANVDASDSEGYTPLLLAVKCATRNHPLVLRICTPEQLAMFDFTHIGIIQLLVRSGADVNRRTVRMWTPLHYAACTGLPEIVEFLIAHGADVNARLRRGLTPLGLPHREDIAEILIEAGADVNCFRESGSTLLHHASVNRWPRVAKLLIKKGVNLHTRDPEHKTPLHMACLYQNPEVIEILVKAGADCNVADINGVTPFNDIIKIYRNLDALRLCIEHGAYITPSDYDKLCQIPELKESIFKDAKLCTQAIMNKFNNQELPILYKLTSEKYLLPQFENMKIVSKSQMAENIEESVKYQILEKGHCNVLEVPNLLLNVMSARCLINYYNEN